MRTWPSASAAVAAIAAAALGAGKDLLQREKDAHESADNLNEPVDAQAGRVAAACKHARSYADPSSHDR